MEDSKLVAYLSQELTAEEAAQVEAWAAQSDENRQKMEQVYYLMQLAQRADSYAKANLDHAIGQFRRDVERKRRYSKERQRTWWQRYSWQVAAFVAGVVLSGTLMMTLLGGSAPYEMTTGKGQRAQLALPDGSKVWLNSSTRLTYNASVWSGRKVKLQGEAYFEVKHSDWKSFEVASKEGIRTRVMGTKFNVRAREAENRVMTTLFEGAVNMYRSADDQVGHRLKPGQTMTVNKENGAMELHSYNNPEEMLSWIKGEMNFHDRSLGDIAQCLEKIYGIRITFTQAQLRKECFTGHFKTDDPVNEVLHTLALTNHFTYKVEGEKVTILPPR